MESKIWLKEMSDGKKIRIGFFTADKISKGVIQIVHGFGENIAFYSSLIRVFNSQNYDVVVHDQRGFGPYSRVLGNQGVASYDEYMNDVREIREEVISKKFPNKPVFLYGFSMGGNVALNYLVSGEQTNYAGAIIESPWFELAGKITKSQAIAVKVLPKISRNITIASKMTHLPIMHEDHIASLFAQDAAFHERMSVRLFHEISERGVVIFNHASKLKIPIMLLGAEDDKIVSYSRIKEFAEKASKNIEFVSVKNGYHALHADTDAVSTIKKMLKFISRNS